MDLKTLNALPSITPKKKERRIGRGTGSGWGKTSGRGHKGAGARSGSKIRDYYEGGQMPLQRRFPKRGFTNAPFKTQYAILNLSDLNRFEDGATISPEVFEETGMIKQPLDGIKILGDGDFERKNLDVTAHRFSKSAIAKLEAAGCKVTSLHTPKKRRTTKAQFERRAREQAKAGKGGKKSKAKANAKGKK